AIVMFLSTILRHELNFIPTGHHVNADWSGFFKALIKMNIIVAVESDGTGHNGSDEIVNVVAAAPESDIRVRGINSPGQLPVAANRQFSVGGHAKIVKAVHAGVVIDHALSPDRRCRSRHIEVQTRPAVNKDSALS